MIYLAAPFFNEEQLETLRSVEDLLKEHGLKFFSPRLIGGVLNDMTSEVRERSLKEVFNSNIIGMLNCDIMLAGTGWRDTGTTWEMGWWYGAQCRRPLLTYAFNGAPANVMLSQSTGHHFASFSELREFIERGNSFPWGERLKQLKDRLGERKPETSE
jgi:nucleoside 2-deoxyribosyltransferase